FFTLNGVSVPSPIQRPRPPLWVGGWSVAAIRRAAALGDAWIGGLTANMAKVAECIGHYRSALASLGKPAADSRIGLEREVFVAADRRDAEAARAAIHRMYLEEHVAWAHTNMPAGQSPSFDDLARDRFIVGDPDEVAHQVTRYRDLGVTHLICRMQYPGLSPRLAAESMRRFAAEVMPGLRVAAA
ncbi:MAG: LLM class flavin-dependent oxidoreductase, partial [Candidatus Rokuibacteriota bacterium]